MKFASKHLTPMPTSSFHTPAKNSSKPDKLALTMTSMTPGRPTAANFTRNTQFAATAMNITQPSFTSKPAMANFNQTYTSM